MCDIWDLLRLAQLGTILVDICGNMMMAIIGLDFCSRIARSGGKCQVFLSYGTFAWDWAFLVVVVLGDRVDHLRPHISLVARNLQSPQGSWRSRSLCLARNDCDDGTLFLAVPQRHDLVLSLRKLS